MTGQDPVVLAHQLHVGEEKNCQVDSIQLTLGIEFYHVMKRFGGVLQIEVIRLVAAQLTIAL